jgi:hypothetical protein
MKRKATGVTKAVILINRTFERTRHSIKILNPRVKDQETNDLKNQILQLQKIGIWALSIGSEATSPDRFHSTMVSLGAEKQDETKTGKTKTNKRSE